jgi:hypothetical protein
MSRDVLFVFRLVHCTVPVPHYGKGFQPFYCTSFPRKLLKLLMARSIMTEAAWYRYHLAVTLLIVWLSQYRYLPYLPVPGTHLLGYLSFCSCNSLISSYGTVRNTSVSALFNSTSLNLSNPFFIPAYPLLVRFPTYLYVNTVSVEVFKL